MSVSEKRVNDPRFSRLNDAAHRGLYDALCDVAVTTGLELTQLGLEEHAGRVVDELTNLLFRADDAKLKAKGWQ